MTDLFTKIIAWLKANMIFAIIIGIGIIILFFPKLLKGLFGRSPRKHKGQGTHTRAYFKSHPEKTIKTKSGKSAIRSVGTHKEGYPAVGGGYVPFRYTKQGKKKDARFVPGTIAAHRHMASLRKSR